VSLKTVLVQKGSDEFILTINRKSRIIMKDALTILKKVEKIKEKAKNASVALETSAPVCSKLIKFLEENGVDVLKSV